MGIGLVLISVFFPFIINFGKLKFSNKSVLSHLKIDQLSVVWYFLYGVISSESLFSFSIFSCYSLLFLMRLA